MRYLCGAGRAYPRLAPVFHDKCLIGVAVDLEVCGLPFLGCGRWL
jgi:hypothetical protein